MSKSTSAMRVCPQPNTSRINFAHLIHGTAIPMMAEHAQIKNTAFPIISCIAFSEMTTQASLDTGTTATGLRPLAAMRHGPRAI